MTIESAGLSRERLQELSAIATAFDVTSALEASSAAESILLTERAIDRPYVKDYDAIGDTPQDWPSRFDTSRWRLLLARVGGRAVGGATVALRTAKLDMLEGRSDLAVLWDIRVAADFRRRGVGTGLFEAVEAWAAAQGCRELKVETQDVNVAACRFYAARGCELRVVRQNAYPECPGEAQLLWYRTLRRAI